MPAAPHSAGAAAGLVAFAELLLSSAALLPAGPSSAAAVAAAAGNSSASAAAVLALLAASLGTGKQPVVEPTVAQLGTGVPPSELRASHRNDYSHCKWQSSNRLQWLGDHLQRSGGKWPSGLTLDPFCATPARTGLP